jgi:hypothetical protein
MDTLSCFCHFLEKEGTSIQIHTFIREKMLSPECYDDDMGENGA